MPLSENQFYCARIVERLEIANDLLVVQVDPGGEFRYTPGQYATLGVVTPEKHYERAYSIASAPHERFVEFFIELVPQGELTPRLFSRTVGDEITLRKIARGRFTLDTASGRTNHLLVATGTGVAPFVSYARSIYQRWKDKQFRGERRFFLLEGASYARVLGYREELQRLSTDVPWFSFAPTISRPWGDSSWGGETGRVDDVLRKYTDNWNLLPENTTAYLCGHPSMIEHAKGILERRGWDRSSIKEEVYFKLGKRQAPALGKAAAS
jgi:ferredoxin/flavodoxin---NADP+ reductase